MTDCVRFQGSQLFARISLWLAGIDLIMILPPGLPS